MTHDRMEIYVLTNKRGRMEYVCFYDFCLKTLIVWMHYKTVITSLFILSNISIVSSRVALSTQHKHEDIRSNASLARLFCVLHL